jgi:hypothetical protein
MVASIIFGLVSVGAFIGLQLFKSGKSVFDR